MCSKRSYEAIAVAISILVGIALALLAFFGFVITGLTAPILGLSLGALALLILTFGTTSLLRQNACVDRCIRQRGRLLLAAALLLIVAAALVLLLSVTNQTVLFILLFLLFTLISLTLIALYGFLGCLIEADEETH